MLVEFASHDHAHFGDSDGTPRQHIGYLANGAAA